MAKSTERPPAERETLMFPTAEEARSWTEQVGEQVEAASRDGVRRDREVVAQAVATEFEKQGESAAALKQPWEHTPQEHEEVQRLVDLAFARDLGAALRRARTSAFYPRNIDLLHDVLTTEMYEMIRQQRLNRQPVRVGLIVTAGVVILAGLLVMWLIVL